MSVGGGMRKSGKRQRLRLVAISCAGPHWVKQCGMDSCSPQKGQCDSSWEERTLELTWIVRKSTLMRVSRALSGIPGMDMAAAVCFQLRGWSDRAAQLDSAEQI